MATFKCKMCGGSLDIVTGTTVIECEYCGTKQTLPKLDDDRRANLYDRANHFRRNNDFDKAMGIYENILNEDNTDAEAYWSIVLCRYGIEYVEDPVTHKRIPTVNRAQFTSTFDDEDYKSAIKYADAHQKELYEKEANAINEIQKGILAISGQEEPFDVFICYKETDEYGRRTQDSVLATELYHELTREGFKVFFSCITLEDKLGVAYEPYIFAALHSAKVMVVLGTRPEHFNAVWVKNEWSRFLALIKNGAKKTLIPAYRDMDPYDLPEEFSHLQAQDMSKLGFMHDLTHGIKKIVKTDAPQATVIETIAASATVTNITPLLKRTFMFLEDGEFDRADDFCEQVLNQDPENAQAYVGKLMVDLRVNRQNDLANCVEPFENNNNYQKAIRFAKDTLADDLNGYIATIKDRNARREEEARKESQYLKALGDYKSYDVARLHEAIKAFTSLSGYKDSEKLIRLCQEKIEQIRTKKEQDQKAYEQLQIERQRQDEINRIEALKVSKQKKKIAIVTTIVMVTTVVFVTVLIAVIIPNKKYDEALALMSDSKYAEAILAFEALDDYKDSEKMISECEYAILDDKYNDATTLMETGKYEEAISAFEAIAGYKDSADKINTCNTVIIDAKYNEGITLMNDGSYTKALGIFMSLGGYKDSQQCASNLAKQHRIWHSISAGNRHTVGLKSDGTVVAVGDNKYGQCNIDDWRYIVAISAGGSHTVGLKSDGTVVAVGDNKYGQCNVDDWSDIVAISAGNCHTVGLKSDGKVLAVGDNDNYACNVGDWNDIVAISAGASHTVGLKSNGTVVSNGLNEDGQCNVSLWNDMIAISAGDYHTVGLKSNGTVRVVGFHFVDDDTAISNSKFAINGWDEIIAISAATYHTMGLKSDGTIVVLGNNDNNLLDTRQWESVTSIAIGVEHAIGVKSNGAVVAVGNNDYGQCNVGNWNLLSN